MSWSLPGWSRQPGTFQLVLGYGEKEDSNNPSSDGSHSDSAPGAPETSNDEKADAASKCKIRVQLEWGAAEDEEGVVLRLQSQLMMALPYPEEEVHVRMVPPSEAAQLTSDATSPSHKRAHSHPPTTPDTNPKPSPGQGNSGDASPSSMTPSSSWGFLDRLAYSIGRNSNAGDIVVSSPDVKATSAPTGPTSASIGATSASTGSASAITGNTSASMELTSAHMASTSAPTGHDQAPGTKTDGPDPGPASIERPRSHEDVHSDNEHFEDAPHHFPASLDTAPADHAGATPGSPEAVSSGGRVPIRTVVKRPGERLRVVLVSKTAGSGVTGDGLGVLNKLVEESELSGVEHLAVTEGLLGFWMQRGPDTWHALRTLDLSGCNLTVVPPSVAHLPALEVLLLDNNKLVAPPAELGKLTSLKRLSMDHNLLLSVPIELRECTSLTELSLEHNRLVRPLLDFRSMARTLQTLRLFGNPLEFLPEILPCRRLRRMSLANVRIEGDPALTSVEVYVEDDAAATSYYFAVGGTKHRLSTFFQLVFRYSSCQHPLLASALARIAEDGENRAYIGRDEGAIRQLLSMVLSDDTHVVQQACRALSSIAMDTTLVARLVKADVLQSIWAVLGSNDPEIQVSVLQVLACVAFCSNSIAARLFTPDMLHRLKELCGGENTLKVREEALLVLGNLAFSPSNRRAMASAQGLRSLLAGIALTVPKPSPNPSQNPGQTHLSSPNPDGSNGEGSDDGSDSNPTRNSSEADGGASIAAASPARAAFHDFDGAPKRAMATEGSALRVRAAAVRALAIMGENELVRKATGRRPVGSRGVKILSLDGGGMRGMATVRMLRRLEKGTGRRLHEVFDLICGTSTGAMLAVALGVKEMSLDECEGIYKRLGKIVFAAEDKDKEKDAASFATWREKLDLMYKSGAQNLRVVIHGAKHDATPFESLLKEMSAFDDGRNLQIETAGRGGPKVSVVSTLVSVTPAQPFVFRNYQYPPGTKESAPWAAPVTPLSPQTNPGSHPPGGGGAGGLAATPAATPVQSRVGIGHVAYMGSCKHLVWQAIRASSAAPYYLDDFSDGNNRWQDGAVTANNPAVIAVREARLLWPDVQIDTLVSLGCANLPTKPRGKNWKHVDTGNVLVESACSVERVEEAMDTLAPLVPNLNYIRFNPVDESGGMELDETDPSQWSKLEAATQAYIDLHDAHFAALCDRLTSDLADAAAPEMLTSASKQLTSDGEPEEPPVLRLRELSARGNNRNARGLDRSARGIDQGDTEKNVGETAGEVGREIGSQEEVNGNGQVDVTGKLAGDVDISDSDGGTFGRQWADAGSESHSERAGEDDFATRAREVGPGDQEPATEARGLDPGIDRGISFSHSFSFGGLGPSGEVRVEPRRESGASDVVDLNPNATWRVDEGATWPSDSMRATSDSQETIFADRESKPEERLELDTMVKTTGGRNSEAGPQGLRVLDDSKRSAGAAALGLRRGLLFVEAPPGGAAAEGFGGLPESASLLHHSSSHRPLIDAVCDQNQIARDVFGVRIPTRPKPTKPPVLTRPVSSPSLIPSSTLPRANSLPKNAPVRPASPGVGLPRVSTKLETLEAEPAPELEEPLSFPVQALYEQLQSGRAVGVVHLALSGDDRGLVLDWQSDVMAVAEPGEEARAFLAKVPGGEKYASLGQLCARHRQFDVGAAVFTLVGRHMQVLPGGDEAQAFIFRRTVPSAFLSADDVRQMVGAWRDRIVVSSRVSLTQPVIEALLDGGAKAVFELQLSHGDLDEKEAHVASSESIKVGSNAIVKDEAGWRSAFAPIARSVFSSSAESEAPAGLGATRDEEEFETVKGLPEDSALEEMIACFYSALYREGLSVGQVGATVRDLESKGKCQLICHLPNH